MTFVQSRNRIIFQSVWAGEHSGGILQHPLPLITVTCLRVVNEWNWRRKKAGAVVGILSVEVYIRIYEGYLTWRATCTERWFDFGRLGVVPGLSRIIDRWLYCPFLPVKSTWKAWLENFMLSLQIFSLRRWQWNTAAVHFSLSSINVCRPWFLPPISSMDSQENVGRRAFPSRDLPHSGDSIWFSICWRWFCMTFRLLCRAFAPWSFVVRRSWGYRRRPPQAHRSLSSLVKPLVVTVPHCEGEKSEVRTQWLSDIRVYV